MAKSKHHLYGRKGLAVTGLVALVAAWFMFFRAVDTGSLQQYAITIFLLVFGLNRLFRAIIPKKQ